MEKDILVSVIIAVYNTEKYLDRCLESITRQTLKDIEIICINDASEDGSLSKLYEWRDKDSRITVVDCEKNMKQGHARNVGIKMAKGKYIGVIDSDDFIDLDMYETLINHSDNLTADLVVSTALKRYKDGVVIKEEKFLHDFSTLDNIKRQIAAHGGPMVTNIIRREYFIEYDLFYPENLIYEDNANGPIIYLKAKDIKVVDKCFYYYCLNPTSTVNKKNQPRYFDRTKTAKICYDRAKSEEFYYQYKEEIDFYFYHVFLYNTVRGALSTFVKLPERELKEVIAIYQELYANDIVNNKYYNSEERGMVGNIVNYACFHPNTFFLLEAIHYMVKKYKHL